MIHCLTLARGVVGNRSHWSLLATSTKGDRNGAISVILHSRPGCCADYSASWHINSCLLPDNEGTIQWLHLFLYAVGVCGHGCCYASL